MTSRSKIRLMFSGILQELPFVHFIINTITDIILSCERKANNNSDTNLINVVLNREVSKILKNNKIKKIFFSSKFVEKLYKKHFKDLILKYSKIELITLPSPSPRYAAMSKSEKISKYKQLLPKEEEYIQKENPKKKADYTVNVIE